VATGVLVWLALVLVALALLDVVAMPDIGLA
jgi:hypothetical protein